MTITPKSWTKHGKIKKHGGRQDELKGLSKIKHGDEPDVLSYGGKEEVERLIEHCKFYNVGYDFMKKRRCI